MARLTLIAGGTPKPRPPVWEHHCRRCGCAITVAEHDENDGRCDDCEAEERPGCPSCGRTISVFEFNDLGGCVTCDDERRL